MDRWSLPAGLRSWVFDHLGVAAPTDMDGVATLIEMLGRTMPRGSTGKLADLAAGRRPAGDDPAVVVEGWRADPYVAWTCWGVATVAAALINASGRLRAEVLGVRRIGPDAPPVDVHSVVIVEDEAVGGAGDGRWVCDPHFGIGPIPATGGERSHPHGRAVLARVGPRFDWTAYSTVFSRPDLRYRSLTGPLDAGDVRAFCDVSVTHTGVGPAPYAMLLLPDGVATARAEDFDGPAEVRVWRDDLTRLAVATWDDACAALHQAAAHRGSAAVGDPLGLSSG